MALLITNIDYLYRIIEGLLELDGNDVTKQLTMKSHLKIKT